MKTKSFVIGGDGLIGSGLAEHLRRLEQPVVTSTRRQHSTSDTTLFLDLTAVPPGWRPPGTCEVSFLCAAISKYEECRKDPLGSRLVNVVNTVRVARQLTESRSFVIYLSSNAVFDGKFPHRKWDDPISPQTEYGRQKAEAERQLLHFGEQICIVRLTKVFPRRPPLLIDWLSKLRKGEPIHPFHDLTCAPLLLDTVVETLITLAEVRRPGMWHLSGNLDISYSALANHLACRLGLDQSLVQPVSVKSSPSYVEHVPAYTSLDCTRLREELRIQAPEAWKTVDSLIV